MVSLTGILANAKPPTVITAKQTSSQGAEEIMPIFWPKEVFEKKHQRVLTKHERMLV